MRRVNEWVAIHATKVFGTMWVTYALFLYGLVPVIEPRFMNDLLYWSNTIQLWSLPLLMVGTNLLGKASEVRAQETHDAVISELIDLKEILADMHLLLDQAATLDRPIGPP